MYTQRGSHLYISCSNLDDSKLNQVIKALFESQSRDQDIQFMEPLQNFKVINRHYEIKSCMPSHNQVLKKPECHGRKC